MLVMVEQEKNLRRDLLEGGVTGKLTLNPRLLWREIQIFYYY